MTSLRVVTAGDACGAYPCVADSHLPWSNGLALSRRWFAQNIGESVEGLHALGEDGIAVGHLYWCDSSHALLPYRLEPGTATVLCEWVSYGHRGQGVVRDMYSKLLRDLRARNCKGIFVEATGEVEYMHRRHFERRGFHTVLEWARGSLMYLGISAAQVQAQAIPLRLPRLSDAPAEVVVVGSLFCPVSASTLLALREVAASFGDRVRLFEFDASRNAVESWGIGHGMFINGKECFIGPVSHETIVKTLEDAVNRR